MKTIKIITKNLKNKPASAIAIALLFTMIVFTAAITSGCCGFGWACGGGYYHNNNGYNGQNNGGWQGNKGNNGNNRGGGEQQGWGH